MYHPVSHLILTWSALALKPIKGFIRYCTLSAFVAVLVISRIFTSLSLGPPTLVSITLPSSCGLPMAHLCYFVSLWLRSETHQPPSSLSFPQHTLSLSSNSNKSSSWPLCLMQVSRAMKGLGLRVGKLRGPFTQTPTCRTIWPRWVTLIQAQNASWQTAGPITCVGGIRSLIWQR